jgi:hypothetical protein
MRLHLRSTNDGQHQARVLLAQADALYNELKARTTAITELENHPETLPRDEFTDQFLVASYQQPVEIPGHGAVMLNEAAKTSVESVGSALATFAQAFSESMGIHAARERDGAESLRRVSLD